MCVLVVNCVGLRTFWTPLLYVIARTAHICISLIYVYTHYKWHPVPVHPVIAQYCQIIAFAKGCLSLMHSFLVTSENVAINHII